MQRDIKRGELLIVFRDTNACLISELALSDYRTKNSEFPRNAAHMHIKKVKEAKLQERKHNIPQNNEAIKALLSKKQSNYLYPYY